MHDFSYRMLRLIRGDRKAAYRLQDQLQAWVARCDKTTDRAIRTAITAGFSLAAGGGGLVAARRYFTDAAAALTADAILYAAGLPAVQQATLTLFAEWFKRTFYRVEAVREATASGRLSTTSVKLKRWSTTMQRSTSFWRSCQPMTCWQSPPTLTTT